MRFNSTIISSFLFALAVLADRRSEHRHSRSVEQHRRSEFISTSDGAGAGWIENHGTFSGVSGTFTVPSLTGAAGSGVVVEVAIDQMTCGGTFFRAGVQLLVVENAGVNQSQYEAFYEWGPDVTYAAPIDISIGDVIKLEVSAFTATTGIAIINNETKNKSVMQRFSSTHELCKKDVMWGVQLDDQYTLAHFGVLAFTNAEAYVGSSVYTPAGARLMQMVHNNQALVTPSAHDDASLTLVQ